MKYIKITSLMIGAAVISSVVPTMQVNASEKLEASDGTIYEAKAFMNGTYVYEGYKDDDQESKVYFYNGKNDVEVEDASAVGNKYGMNYMNFSTDDILFNLATGQAEEDDEEAKVAMMESKFKSSVIKKADRYEDTEYLLKVGKIAEDIFSGVWYEYLVAENNDIDNPGKYYIVYLSDTGKYVDTSETLNIVYYDNNGKKISLDTYEDVEKNNNLSIVKEETLLIDAENIYKVIALLDKEKALYLLDDEGRTELIKLISEGKNKEAAGYILRNCPKAITTYALKISMEQGEKEDGAYIPKSVTSYETYDLNALELISEYKEGKVTARVSGSNLYIIKPDFDDESITVDRYKLKKIKDKQTFDDEVKTLDKRVLELDEDFDYIQNEDMIDYDIDVQGNIWILNKGKIQKFENGKIVTKYTVDRSMDKLSVFAENSLIVWNSENEIYAAVGAQPVVEEKPQESTEATESKEEVTEGNKEEVIKVTGWIKNTDGTWNFNKEDGSKATGWILDNNKWYYLNSQGVMQTGWVKDSNIWYYLNASGAMHTGWLRDTNGTWYYLNTNGSMACNTVIDGYKLDASGAWIQ